MVDEPTDLGVIEKDLDFEEFVKVTQAVIDEEKLDRKSSAYRKLMQTRKQSVISTLDSKKTKIKKKYINLNPRILKVEQESMLCPRICCASYYRPYEAYAVSSNGSYEYGVMRKQFKI